MSPSVRWPPKPGVMETDAAFIRRAGRATSFLPPARPVHPRARQIHLDMAGRYADLARAIDPGALPEEDQVQAPERACIGSNSLLRISR